MINCKYSIWWRTCKTAHRALTQRRQGSVGSSGTGSRRQREPACQLHTYR